MSVKSPSSPPGWRVLATAFAGLVLCGAPLAAAADEPQSDGQSTAENAPEPPRNWAVHVQATDVLQWHPAFRSAFQGQNSLSPRQNASNTVNASLIAGARPWAGAQIWFDLDMNQGFAPSNTLGVAGYVNGEGAKVGHHSPYYRPQRFFLRQTFELGGGATDVDPDLYELGGKTTRNRLVVTLGKFTLTDVVDDNRYAHDPTNDFLNWALIDTGTWDYAADAWGFSYGGAAELYEGAWTLRGAVMDLSTIPNQAELTPWFGQFQLDGEVERRQSWLGREGKIKVLVFASRGRMGRFADAIALAQETGQAADTALVRHYRTRAGVSLNIEQPVSDDAGLFLRAGWDQGQYEPYEYADIDGTVAGGGSLTGARWGRKDDTVAVALLVNSISKVHQAYLNAGGLGILVGDGRLPRPGPETILEAYYNLALLNHLHVTLDSQTIVDPAYNRDRGPVEVVGFRFHGQW